MSYILGQYNKNINTADDSIFMTLITQGTALRKQAQGDSGVSGGEIVFENECVKMNTPLTNGNNYYFHGKIKRMDTTQIINIKLINYDSTEYAEQFIKTITIGEGSVYDWVDIEFLFTPYSNFDTILFELQRATTDYIEGARQPIIIYEELNIINNIVPIKIKDGVELIKIGVQTRPGLLMCINGEEIRVSRTGIYELKSELMYVYFFSVVNAATETTSILGDSMTAIAALIEEYEEEYTEQQTREKREAEAENIHSVCLFDQPKTRVIDSFTLDYIYREE